jgi:hypothetical protein
MDLPDITKIAVGSDVVEVGDRTVTVFAMRPMPDWTVREFCIVPIFFRGHKFHLKAKLPGPPPYAWRYELEPWYSELGAESSLKVVYDEEYVTERDADARASQRREHLHAALFVIYPFLGFCWSGFKERVLGPIGFDPVDTTEASIMIGLGLFLAEGVFAFYFRAGFLGVMFSQHILFWLDWVLLVLLPLDCAIRYGHIIRGDSCPAGFLEWMFKRTDTGRKGGLNPPGGTEHHLPTGNTTKFDSAGGKRFKKISNLTIAGRQHFRQR